MNFKKVAVLTSKESWFVPYAQQLLDILIEKGYDAKLFFNDKEIEETCEIVFILSYFRLVKGDFLKLHKHNLVVHESDLPKGRGWSPLFWQILEGSNKIPVSLFEATERSDEGDVYLKDFIEFDGYELHDEIRKKQALKTIDLCIRFLDEYPRLKATRQKGDPTYCRKREPGDSKLDINMTIREQFNLLRIASNSDYPAFFFIDGRKYTLKIYKSEEDEMLQK